MIIPTGEYSDNNIQRYIDKRKSSLSNLMGDSLLIFSHNYHRLVDESIDLYIKKGEVCRIKNNKNEDKPRGLFAFISPKNKEEIESVNSEKRCFEKKRSSTNNLKVQMDILSKIDLQKYLLNLDDFEKIAYLLEKKGFQTDISSMLASLIVDYENLKIYTLKQDYELAKDFLNNEKEPNYEIELIKNEKSRVFMKYQDDYRDYINSIENMIRKNRELDDESKEFIERSNENIRTMVTESINYIRDGKTPSSEIMASNYELITDIVNSDRERKGKYKELLDSHKYVEVDYSRIVKIRESEKVKVTTEDIYKSASEQELANKKKKTF